MATWQAARLLLVMWLSAFSPFVVHAQTATPHPERLIFHFADSINALLGNTTHGHNIDECTSTLYLKHNMFTKRRGPIVRYIPNMPRLERGMHHYQTEVQMRIQFHPYGETDCKIVACNSNAPYLQPERFGSWGRFSFQIYQPKLFIDRLLNPFSRRNSIYYKYTVRQTMPTHDAKPTTMRVDIRPRFNNDQLAKGYADINMLTGAVVHFELSFTTNCKTSPLTPKLVKKVTSNSCRQPCAQHLISSYSETEFMKSATSTPHTISNAPQPHCITRSASTTLHNNAYYASTPPMSICLPPTLTRSGPLHYMMMRNLS